MTTIPAGTAVLALVGDVCGAAADDARAKADVLLGYPHVRHLVVDLRSLGRIDPRVLDHIELRAAACGTTVEVREPGPF